MDRKMRKSESTSMRGANDKRTSWRERLDLLQRKLSDFTERMRDLLRRNLGELASALWLVKIPIEWLITAAIAIFVSSTVVAYLQLHKPYVWHESRTASEFAWWIHPLERNVDAGLPDIEGNINAVALQHLKSADKPLSRTWIAGDKGLLAFSDDDGRTWVQLSHDASSGEFHIPNSPSTTASSLGAIEFLETSAILPTVFAAEPVVSVQQSNPSTAQQPKRRKPDATQSNAAADSKQATVNSLELVPPQSELNFGEVPVSSKRSRQINILNSAAAPTPIYVVRVQNGINFSIAGTDCGSATLALGQTCTANIVFHPVSAETKEDVLVVMGPDKQERQMAKLLGIGTSVTTTPALGETRGKQPAAPIEPPRKSTATTQNTADAPPEALNLTTIDFSRPKSGLLAASSGKSYSSSDDGRTWLPSLADVLKTGPIVKIGSREFRLQQGSSGPTLAPSPEVYATIPDNTRTFRVRRDNDVTPRTVFLETAAKDSFGSTANWQLLAPWRYPDPDVTGLWAGSSAKLWLTANFPEQNSAQVWLSSDGGKTWTYGCRAIGPSPASLYTGIVFEDDGRKGWIVGGGGRILRTEDGGRTCEPVTLGGASILVRPDGQAHRATRTYQRFLPPWYWVSLAIAVVLVSPLVAGEEREPRKKTGTPGQTAETKVEPISITTEETLRPPISSSGDARTHQISGGNVTPPSADKEFSIANVAVSDRPLQPGEPDALGLGMIAGALSFFLRNKDTQPPLCIAVTGPWGCGKTSLMFLLKRNLQTYGTRPVWFNAWHHQKEDQLLAALLEAVKQQAAPRLWDRDWLKFRARLLWKRLGRYAAYAVLFVLLVAGVLWGEMKLQENHYSMLAGVAYYLNHWFSKPSESATQAAAAAKALRDEGLAWQSEAKRFSDLADRLEGHAKNSAAAAQSNQWRTAAESLHLTAAESIDAAATERLPEDENKYQDAARPNSLSATQPDGLASDLLTRAGALRRLGQARKKRASRLFLNAGIFAQEELDDAEAAGKKHPFHIDADASLQRIPLASVFAALGLLLLASLKCLVAFGVHPSALLEGVKDGKGTKKAKEKAGLRSRFASEFADVTWAHGPKRTLLILIDDLDRCRPDKVREVLEAVNFLVSSGDCYVVLGMDPEFVRQCLGISFRDVVEAMPGRVLGLLDSATSEQKRDIFARRYLEKLIQIEVAIPEPTDEQQPKLFTREESANEKRVQGYLSVVDHVRAFSRGLLHLSTEIVFAALILGLLGWSVRAAVKRGDAPTGREETRSTALARTDEIATTTKGGATPPLLASGAVAAASPSAKEAAQESRTKPDIPTPKITNADTSASNYWLLLPLALPFVLLYLTLTRPPELVTHDTKPFKNALDTWYPLVMLDHRNTPRNAKRFVNRVRYLAMRQKSLQGDKSTTKGERLLRRWLTGTPEAPRPDRPSTTVPESLLVPLAALHECDPQWIEDTKMFEQVADAVNNHLKTNTSYGLLLEGLIRRHQEAFRNWPQISEYRDAFLAMQGEIASH